MSEGWQYYLDFKDETFELSQGEHTVGRSRTCEVSVNDPSVSRRHVLVEADSGHVLLKDLGSSNGTFINGERVEGNGELHDGDTLGLGDADLKVRVVGTSAFETVRMSAHPVEQHGEATLFLQQASEKLAAEAMDHEQELADAPSHMAPPPPEPASHMAPPPVQPAAAPPEPASHVEPPPVQPSAVLPEPALPVAPEPPPSPEPPAAAPEPPPMAPPPAAAPEPPPPMAPPPAAAPEPSPPMAPPPAAAPEPPPPMAPPPAAAPEPPPPAPETPAPVAAGPLPVAPPPPAAPPTAPSAAALGAQSVLDHTTGDQASGDLLPSLDGFDITMGPEMMRAVKPQAEEGSTEATAAYNPYSAPQAPSQEAAGFGIRFAAFFVDWLWMAGLNLAVYYAGKSLGPAVTSSAASAVAFLVVLFGWAIWGSTPGKRVFNLYVTSGTGGGAGIGFPRALARVIGYVLSLGLLGIGFLMIFSSSKRGLHDLLAGTQVQRQV